MDILMESQVLNSGVPSLWDFVLKQGLAEAIYDKVEEAQQAAVACFLEQGTVPGIEQAGIPWGEFLTGRVSSGELDAKLRSAINIYTGGFNYVPYYYEKNGRLQVALQEAKNGN